MLGVLCLHGIGLVVFETRLLIEVSALHDLRRLDLRRQALALGIDRLAHVVGCCVPVQITSKLGSATNKGRKEQMQVRPGAAAFHSFLPLRAPALYLLPFWRQDPPWGRLG